MKVFKKIFCLLLSQLCTAFVFILCWYDIIIVSCKCWAFTADSCWEMMLSWIMLANTVLWCDQFSAPIINSQLLPLREAKTQTDERNSVVEAVGADVLYQFLCSLQTYTILQTELRIRLHRQKLRRAAVPRTKPGFGHLCSKCMRNVKGRREESFITTSRRYGCNNSRSPL